MSSTYKHEENADHLANDPPKGLIGLQNLGNTCFMNASLQVLSQCPPLTDLLLCPSPFFRAEPPKLATAYTNLLSEIWSATRPRVAVPNSVLNAIRAVHPMFRGFAQHDSPEFIRAFLNDLHEELKVTTEEDLSSEDGKRHLIHGSYPNGEAGGKPATKSSHSPLLPKDREAVDTKQQPVNLPQPARSPITDIFQGKMMTSVKCLSCGQVSNRQEVFLDLSLPITGRRPINSLARVQHSPCARNVSLRWPTFLQRSSPPTPASPSKSRTRGRSANSSSWSLVGATQPLRGAVAVGRHVISPLARGSVALFATLLFYLLFALSWLQSFVWSPTVQLDDCLAAFFAEDELSGENQYYCSRCAKLSNGLMHSELIRLPEVLCLHLKRFRNDSHSLSKISSSVTFPLHRLDLSSYLHPSCSDKVTTYDLMGVICHTGGVTFGHYYGYALNRYTHSWYEFDDAIVSPVDESEVAALSSRAYVLVYRKQDDNIAPLRIQVDSLATEYSLSPSKADSVWVDRRWLTRFSTFSDPGPVNNEDFLCSHGYFKPILWEHRDEYVCQIPVKIWNLLIERFGGGPMVRTLESCATCESTLQALNERRQHEKDAYLRLPRLQGAPKYVISAKWLDSWINFVEGHQINPPGPIANSDVLELVPSLDPKCPPVYQWRRGSAYELIPIGWWNLLFEIYGGGPVCVVPNAPSSPSTEALEDENESDEEVDDNDKEEEEKSEDQEEDVGPQADSFGQSSGTHLATSTALLKEDEKDEDDGGAWHRPHMGEEDVIMPGANQSSPEHPELMDVDTASFLYNDEEDTDDAQSPDFLSSKDELTSDATITSPLLSSSFGYPLTHSGTPPSYRLPSQGSSVSLPAPDLNPVPTPVTHTATTVHEMGLRSLTPTLLERSRLPLGDHKFSLTNNTDAHAEAKVILPPNASGDCDDLHRSKRLDSVVVLSQPFCVQERTFTPQPANGYSAIARSSNSRLSESI